METEKKKARSEFLQAVRAFCNYHFEEIKETPRSFAIIALDKSTEESFVATAGTEKDVVLLLEQILDDDNLKFHTIKAIQNYLARHGVSLNY